MKEWCWAFIFVMTGTSTSLTSDIFFFPRPQLPAPWLAFAQKALCINVGEILNDYSIYAMFHELLREAGELVPLYLLVRYPMHTSVPANASRWRGGKVVHYLRG